jgi:hypothetical protein
MGFRGRQTAVMVTTAAPTESIDIGDAFITGGVGLAADAGHQHAFGAPTLVQPAADAPNVGASPRPAREDHVHDLLAPNVVSSVSAAAALGASVRRARQDHVHDLAPALLGPGGAVDLSVYFAGLPAAGVGVQYVAQGGNDTNDGRSWGSAKATLGAAILALPAGGGIISVGDGTWVLAAPAGLAADTTIEGRGMDATTIQIDPAHWAAFDHDYLIGVAGGVDRANCTVRDLTLDGNHRAGGSAANQGGCISPGSHWLVERVRLHDCNYFKVFTAGKTGTRISKCRFTGYQGNDNVGGGGLAGGALNHGVIVEDCIFEDDISGPGSNAIDFTNGDGYVIRNNQVRYGGNVFLEGCTDSLVDGNHLAGGELGIQDDSGYSPATVTMPRNTRIVNNELDGVAVWGIRVRYFDWVGATARVAGGNNVVQGNQIRNAQNMAILIDGFDAAFKTRADTVIGNQIDRTNLSGANTANSGSGVYRNAGIVVGMARGDIVAGNTIGDSQAVPTMQYGIALSGISVGAAATVVGALVQGNTIRDRTTAGVFVGGTAGQVDAATAIRDNPGHNPLGAVNAAVGASPWTYTCGHTPEVLHLRGGTITTVVKDGVTLYAATDVAVALEPGEQVTVTYTVAPTATADRK